MTEYLVKLFGEVLIDITDGAAVPFVLAMIAISPLILGLIFIGGMAGDLSRTQAERFRTDNGTATELKMPPPPIFN